MIKLGLTSILDNNIELINGKSIGLITNLTGVDEKLDYNISLFQRHPEINLKAIFSPEHGLWGSAQDAVSVSSFQYDNIPIYSLYGSTMKPTSDMLNGLDTLIFDIQDVGVRFYTYISTMALAMLACAENDLEFIVLDRPNPIGDMMEGNVLDPKFTSFVGHFPILLRHGLTVGELAKLFNEHFGIGVNLKVVMMENWKRDMWFDETGLHWVMPSPNMPTLDTATVYSGMCLFEGTNLSEGRGTTKPFEIIGAPYIDAYMLADMLNEMNLHGVKFRPTYFNPIFSKHKDKSCGGVQIHVIDRNSFLPVRTALYMIASIKKAYPDDFQWIGKGRPFFDLLMGTDKVRIALSNNQPVDDIISLWRNEQKEFSDIRSKYLLYP
jgi:beta-N-acetylhexosaminidase